MKKIITSAGLLAFGAASLQAATLPRLSNEAKDKPWNIGAELRGFYDDNYATSVHALKQDSFGFEVKPAASVNLISDQTYLGLSYVYDMRYYFDRQDHKADHSHQANVKLTHAFSERYRMDLSDSFVIAQEPAILEPFGAVVVPLRSEGDNLRNTAQLSFAAELTEKLSTVVGYSNTIFDYEQSGPASRSALLDRVENLGYVNLRWQALRTTVALVGYQYQQVDYTSKDRLTSLIPVGNPNYALTDPEVRNNYSNYGYVGADHFFNPELSASIRVGVQFTQYPNVPGGLGLDDSSTSPYVDANSTWNFLEHSFFQLGVRHSRTQTDIAFFGGNLQPTVDAETTAVYAMLSHRITPSITGSLLGQFQHSSFQGGFADNLSDNFLITGLDFEYEINKFLSAVAGYNYDRLDSDLGGRSYTRNRVYVGIRASY